MIAFAVAVVAGPGAEPLVKMLVAEAHLVAEEIAPCHDAARGLRAALPIVHVVLLKGAGRPEHPHTGEPDGFLDLRRGGLVGEDPGPDLGLVGPPRVPHTKGPRCRAEHR